MSDQFKDPRAARRRLISICETFGIYLVGMSNGFDNSDMTACLFLDGTEPSEEFKKAVIELFPTFIDVKFFMVSEL